VVIRPVCAANIIEFLYLQGLPAGHGIFKHLPGKLLVERVDTADLVFRSM
jgi:hypothetical protein